MKNSRKLGLVALFIIAILPTFLLIKVLGRQIRTAALMNRQPTAATQLLRGVLKDCDEVRVYDSRISDAPVMSVPYEGKKLFTLRGDEATELLRCLHVDPVLAGGKWTKYGAARTNITEPLYSIGVRLVFYRSDKMLGSLFVSTPLLRWYTPATYKADAQILPQSNEYVKDVISQYGWKPYQ